nr:unnamed protein product [Spirometra erinaceieuropaei]
MLMDAYFEEQPGMDINQRTDGTAEYPPPGSVPGGIQRASYAEHNEPHINVNGTLMASADNFTEESKARRCAFLFSNNASKDHYEFKHLAPLHSMQYFLSLNKDSGKLCEAFKRDLFPTEVPVAAEERDFPLGFILNVYKSINQVARLLRLIYRPQNFYVIHVDRKSPQEFYDAVQEIAKCFGANVGVVLRNESVSVIWGDYTVLEQELVAARMLLQMGSQSLPDLIRAPELFANKFHEDYYPEGYSCLEFAIANRSYQGPAPDFDPSVYARFRCSLEHM